MFERVVGRERWRSVRSFRYPALHGLNTATLDSRLPSKCLPRVCITLALYIRSKTLRCLACFSDFIHPSVMCYPLLFSAQPPIWCNVMCTPSGVIIGYPDWCIIQTSVHNLLIAMGAAKSYPPAFTPPAPADAPKVLDCVRDRIRQGVQHAHREVLCALD